MHKLICVPSFMLFSLKKTPKVICIRYYTCLKKKKTLTYQSCTIPMFKSCYGNINFFLNEVTELKLLTIAMATVLYCMKYRSVLFSLNMHLYIKMIALGESWQTPSVNAGDLLPIPDYHIPRKAGNVHWQT